MDKTSKEVGGALKEARKRGGKRRRGVREKGKEEGIKTSPSSLAAKENGWSVFRKREESDFSSKEYFKPKHNFESWLPYCYILIYLICIYFIGALKYMSYRFMIIDINIYILIQLL